MNRDEIEKLKERIEYYESHGDDWDDEDIKYFEKLKILIEDAENNREEGKECNCLWCSICLEA